MKTNLIKRLDDLEEQSGATAPLYVIKDDKGYWNGQDCYTLEGLRAAHPGRRVVVIKILDGDLYADL